jgi:DNA-3-methyladenine glycosylase
VKPVARSFFKRRVDEVARDLVGAYLVHDDVALRITECEAYGPETDTAAHSRAGLTSRTEPMFGEPGHAYVYLCYGIHWMLNLVTSPKGIPEAVLIRSCEVVGGLDSVISRRHARMPLTEKTKAALVAGPGKVTQALALDGSFNNHDLCAPGGLFVARGTKARVATGTRIGIDYAELFDRNAIRRYALADNLAVTHRAQLR